MKALGWLRTCGIGLCVLGVVCLLCGGPGPGQAAEIPLDSKGLPLWEVRQFDDFPVRIELQDANALNELLARVPIASFHREQMRPLQGSGTGQGLVFEPRITAQEAAALQQAGIAYERIPDLFKVNRQEAERAWAEQAARGDDLFKYGDRSVYHTHAQIGALLEQIATDHPTIAYDFLWGNSVQGRQLWGIVISDNAGLAEAEPEVRLSSSMHGDEPVGMEMLLRLAEYLTDNYDQPGYEDVTNLVDNYEIHIMPLHNPDGYVAAQRYNANGVDLNRNFPEPAGTHPVQETETVSFMNYGFANDFVVSQNMHGGALVVNYPWDYTYTLAPDNDALIKLSLEYSTYNLPMYNGSFPQGITNGAQWYITTGCLQDWSYEMTDCIDVTLEISNDKWPSASTLDGFWEDNRESLMHYIKAARYGVNGLVTAAGTGQPLLATVAVAGIDKPVTTDPTVGDYYKLLDTGTYSITFSATGYVDQTITGVTTTWGTPTILDVQLAPVPQGTIHGVVVDSGGGGLSADIAVHTYPGLSYVTTVQSDGADGGAYSLSLPYGDYQLTASAPGHGTAMEIATAGEDPTLVTFVLSTVETLDVFADGFESGTGQWSGDWGLADPAQGHESDNSMTDSPGAGVDYPNHADLVCEMADPISLAGTLAGSLSFWAKWDIENNWDCVLLEVSTDGGGSWAALATQHTHAGSGQGTQTPAGIPVFEGTQNSWVHNSVDLAPWLGEFDVRFRLRLRSDSSSHGDGFYCDDVLVQLTREVTTAVDLRPVATLSHMAAAPNPFNPQTSLSFTTARIGAVQLTVYDLQGRRVRGLVDEILGAGTHRAVWDGLTDRGASVASGLYFARLSAAGEQQTLKLMLVK